MAADSSTSGQPDSSLVAQMLEEAIAMAKYAKGKGVELPGWVVELLAGERTPGGELDSGLDVAGLARAHGELSRLVYPAMPRVIVLMEKERQRPFGPFPIVRQMLLAAMIALTGFVATYIVVNLAGFIDDPMAPANGVALVANQCLYLFAAALGATFWILMEIFITARNGVYDPNASATYWLRLVLGLMAGLILATWVDYTGDTGDADRSMATQRLMGAGYALLGGFSARTVFDILFRMIKSLEGTLGDAQADQLETRAGSGAGGWPSPPREAPRARPVPPSAGPGDSSHIDADARAEAQSEAEAEAAAETEAGPEALEDPADEHVPDYIPDTPPSSLSDDDLDRAVGYNRGRRFGKQRWKRIQEVVEAEASGVPSVDTAERIAEFQARHYLEVDGRATPATLALVEPDGADGPDAGAGEGGAS